jgi:hypothetical protein
VGPVVILATLVVAVAQPAPVLSADAIGGVHFGISRGQAVAELSTLLGRPSGSFVNGGCGARYSEVAWGHLYVEFRAGRLSGYRYLEDGWPPSRYGVQRRASDLPRLATAKHVTLGSTLAQVRAAYGRLLVIGTDRWATSDGLVFSDAHGRIVEIKRGTCGDF